LPAVLSRNCCTTLADLPSPFSKSDKGIRVSVRLTPSAAKDRIDGIVADTQGNGVLRIAVSAVPEQGRANKAMIKLLAKQWRLPKSSLSVTQGAKDRNKVLNIEGDTDRRYVDLLAWSRELLKEQE
jgi:uncharacterized protein